MIKHGGKEITAIVALGKAITLVKKAGRTLWQSVRSCFAAGYWIDEKPWLDDEAWKD